MDSCTTRFLSSSSSIGKHTSTRLKKLRPIQSALDR